ncbi:hypothetical protein UPYG_G00318250 [Umbra pygmaea]|uniref:Uncharacterized protein n=1 Tax=Umbra pygmaea TaxID=75934 RepID=A0ABD0W4N6_UMBPY
MVKKVSGVEELKVRWPALFSMDEINDEFMRIITVPLQTRFMASLDKYHSKLDTTETRQEREEEDLLQPPQDVGIANKVKEPSLVSVPVSAPVLAPVSAPAPVLVPSSAPVPALSPMPVPVPVSEPSLVLVPEPSIVPVPVPDPVSLSDHVCLFVRFCVCVFGVYPGA